MLLDVLPMRLGKEINAGNIAQFIDHVYKLPRKLSLRLLAIGALQYGVMYITYIASFRFLKAYEVALFTIFTPIYVTLFNDLFARRFKASWGFCSANQVDRPHYPSAFALTAATVG